MWILWIYHLILNREVKCEYTIVDKYVVMWITHCCNLWITFFDSSIVSRETGIFFYAE